MNDDQEPRYKYFAMVDAPEQEGAIAGEEDDFEDVDDDENDDDDEDDDEEDAVADTDTDA
jgi:hypothetical protein